MASWKKTLGALAAGALIVGGSFSTPAAAGDSKFGYSISLTGASDYMFRGQSYTQEDPEVYSYVELTYGIAYLGFWTSNIDTGDCDGCLGPWEQDIYFGIRPVTGPVNWDLGVLWYIYGVKGTFDVGDFDVVEFKIAATTSPIKNLTLGLTGYYTPDQDRAITETATIEGTASYTLPQMGVFSPTISGTLGYWDSNPNSIYADGYFFFDDGSAEEAYTYWNAGVKLTADRFFMDLRYWDTDHDSDLYDERFVFSAGVNLAP